MPDRPPGAGPRRAAFCFRATGRPRRCTRRRCRWRGDGYTATVRRRRLLLQVTRPRATAGKQQSARAGSMLLCPVKGLPGIDLGGWRSWGWAGALAGVLGCGQDREGPLRGGRASSYEVTRSRSVLVRERPANRSKASRCGSRILGQAAPLGYLASAGGAQRRIDLAGDVTLAAADDLGLGFSFCGAALGAGAGDRVRAHAGEHDPPQSVAGLAPATGVEPVADGLARGCRDRSGSAQVRPGGLAAQPPGMVSRGDEQQRRRVRSDPIKSQQAGAQTVTRGTMSSSRRPGWPSGNSARRPARRGPGRTGRRGRRRRHQGDQTCPAAAGPGGRSGPPPPPRCRRR